jgi:hypothetical protein
MTSIYDIPYEDIKFFISNNNVIIPSDKNSAYKLALSLIEDPNSKGHTRSIVEWIIAYNLIQNNVDIPTYTINEIDNIDEKEINKLARMLTMKTNNVSSIKNILNYMGKLILFPTKINEIDYQLLMNMDTKTLNKLETDKYTKLLLNDQNFWKERLFNRLGLKVKDDFNFDYKFAVKFLDNGESFEVNNLKAMDKGLKQIVKLLLDNDVVDRIKPDFVMDDLKLNIFILGDLKHYPYYQFIDNIIGEINKNNDNPITIQYFDKIVFTDSILNIRIEGYPSISSINVTNEGLSNGEILYKFAQLIPNNDELKELRLQNIEKNREEILYNINSSVDRYDHYSYKYSEISFQDLLENPQNFLDFLETDIDIKLIFNSDYYIQYPFGNYHYWDRVEYEYDYDNYYTLVLRDTLEHIQ